MFLNENVKADPLFVNCFMMWSLCSPVLSEGKYSLGFCFFGMTLVEMIGMKILCVYLKCPDVVADQSISNLIWNQL